MKKVLATLVMGGLAVSAFAQGSIGFSSSASLVRYESGTAVAVSGGQAQFAWAPVGASYTPWTTALTAEAWKAANPAWTVLGAPATITPVAGRFSGGTLTAQTSAPGAIIQGVVIGWTGIGASDFLAGYSNVLKQAVSPTTAQFGITAPFTVDTGDTTTVPPGSAGLIYNSTATPFTGLTLVPVPEPTSFALAGLGAAALLIFRRRK